MSGRRIDEVAETFERMVAEQAEQTRRCTQVAFGLCCYLADPEVVVAGDRGFDLRLS